MEAPNPSLASIPDCKFFKSVLPMKLDNLMEIENHVAIRAFLCFCPHSTHTLKDFTFNGNTATGTTPLILACQHGELDSVKHIVESWGVDVSASAPFYSNPSQQGPPTIQEATPLFVAAFHGYDQIVRYLLERGANVSVKTSNKKKISQLDGWTPLYAAVFDRQFNSSRPLHQQREDRCNIVRSLLEYGADPVSQSFRPAGRRPMWIEKMCGVEATTALINNGLDLNRRFLHTGRSLLHHWASRPHDFTEEDSLVIIKLLIDKGADLTVRDNEGLTPLLTAAKHFNFKILDYLFERIEFGRSEKIEAMELTGAAILFEAENSLHFPKAFEYWRRALKLRQMEIEVSGSSAEKILGRKIGRNVEWTTLAELDQIEQHPEDYRIQALLVKLRILSGCIGVAHQDLSTSYIDYLSGSASLDNEEKFTQILDILWGRFDVMIRRLDSLHTDRYFWTVVENDVDELVNILSSLEENHPHLLNFEKLKTSLDLILLATYQSPVSIYNDVPILLRMIFHLPEILKEHEKYSLIQSLRPLGRYRLGNLLLPACRKLVNLETLALVRVLLEAGANPNVLPFDELHGNASLHVVAGLSDRQLGDAAGRLLIEFGAKLHQVNKAGKTALDIWIELNETEDKWNEEIGGWSERPEWCLPVRTLQCLSARVIRMHRLPYADGNTPATLHSLIELR